MTLMAGGQVEAGCGVAIRNDKGALLLIRRLRPPEAGAWGLPGGKIEYGERAERAAVREVAEELGIEIVVSGLACLAETIDRGDGRHWIAPVYAATIRAGTPKVMEPDKHGGWGWFACDRLPEPLTDATICYLRTLAGTGSEYAARNIEE